MIDYHTIKIWHYRITALPHYRITALPHYRITALPHYRITALPHYRITALIRCRGPRHQPIGQQGFSLVAVLISVLIIGISMSAAISMMSIQHRDMKSLKHQLVAMNIKHHIIQTIKNPENCNCHFTQDPADTDATGANLGPFTIDTTINGDQTSPDINLGSFRSGCDFTSTHNVIAAAGGAVNGGAGLRVSSVRVTEITATGTPDEYAGMIQVTFARDGTTHTRHQAEVDIRLSANLSPADPTKAAIVTCNAGAPRTAVVPATTVMAVCQCEYRWVPPIPPKRYHSLDIIQQSGCIKCENVRWEYGQFDLLRKEIKAECPPGQILKQPIDLNNTILLSTHIHATVNSPQVSYRSLTRRFHQPQIKRQSFSRVNRERIHWIIIENIDQRRAATFNYNLRSVGVYPNGLGVLLNGGIWSKSNNIRYARLTVNSKKVVITTQIQPVPPMYYREQALKKWPYIREQQSSTGGRDKTTSRLECERSTAQN